MDEIFKFGLAALAIFAFGIGMILLEYFTTKKRKYIKKHGITIDAEITGNRAFYDPSARAGITSYYISCKYITKNNEKITKEYKDIIFRKFTIDKRPVGSKIKIIYLPEEPRQSIIKDPLLEFSFIIMKITGFGLIGLSAFILYHGIITIYFS